jgi:hypothetical protein
MFRRTLLVAVFASLAFVLVASSALAYSPLWSQPVNGASRLVAGADGATVVWAVDLGGGDSALLAAHYTRAGAALPGSPFVLETNVAGLGDWCATGDGSRNVTVVWKAGGVTSAKRVQLGGPTLYGPVTVCSDAAVAALRGAGATAAPVSVTADTSGGVYVCSAVSPSSTSGDTLLNYVSPLGALSGADPGVAVAKGTVAAIATDASGAAWVLLGAPGRTGLAVQRYDSALIARWASPISPYSPFEQPSATTQVPLGLTAASTATIAWREGPKVRVQSFDPDGLVWLRTTAVTMAGAVELTGDGASGCYLVGPSGSSIVARHIDAGGLEVAAPGSVLPGVGLPQPRVDALTANRAGDLTAAFSDVASAAVPGIAQLTCIGRWQNAGLASAPEWFSGAAQDGAGGAYVLGAGGAAALLRVGEAGTALTCRPRTALVRYGKSVTVGGYLTTGGEPLSGSAVTLGPTGGGVTRDEVTATTDGQGFYRASVAPKANASWTAHAAGASSESVVIRVMPKITLRLSHLEAGKRLTEILSGGVTPAHSGQRVLVQRQTASGGWRNVASGRLDRRSHYSIRWSLPYRTATYKLRTVVTAHADHAEGASQTATLRVKIRRG